MNVESAIEIVEGGLVLLVWIISFILNYLFWVVIIALFFYCFWSWLKAMREKRKECKEKNKTTT